MLGFSNDPDLQKLLSGGLLLIYVMTVVGNLGMVALILMDSRLHSPVDFFLSVLSFLDICYSSVVTPTLLLDFLASDRSIPFKGCVVQMTFFVMHATAESFLLASMACDHCTATCQPLHYSSVMTRGPCLQLVAASSLSVELILLSRLGMSLPCLSAGPTRYCTTSVTSNPFPPGPEPTQPWQEWSVLCIFSALATYLPAALILTSYGLALVAIGRMRSAAGKENALSTCASHFLAIATFHSTMISPTSSLMDPSMIPVAR